MHELAEPRNGGDVAAVDLDLVGGPVVVDRVGVAARHKRAVVVHGDHAVGDQLAVNAEHKDHAGLDVFGCRHDQGEVAARDRRAHRTTLDRDEAVPARADDAGADKDCRANKRDCAQERKQLH